MEVSSHALDKDRIHGLEFDEVAFTNLTQDVIWTIIKHCRKLC